MFFMVLPSLHFLHISVYCTSINYHTQCFEHFQILSELFMNVSSVLLLLQELISSNLLVIALSLTKSKQLTN